ncbi:MAG TPA: TIGR02594 family protein [Pseudolabrys sp.]
MRLTNSRAAFVLCSVAMAALTTAAEARPAHKAAYRQAHNSHHHYRHSATRIAVAPVSTPALFGGADNDSRYSSFFGAQPETAATPARRGRSRYRAVAQQSTAAMSSYASGGSSSSSLVSEARRYLGTNPTGRRSLWCGAFMDMVLRETGHPGGGNLALAYARYGRRVSGPQVGAIAVMGRRGGGHVGVVSGVDPNGNPIIVSGNHNRTVAESVYPRGRITAYVMPGS